LTITQLSDPVLGIIPNDAGSACYIYDVQTPIFVPPGPILNTGGAFHTKYIRMFVCLYTKLHMQ